MVRMTIFILKIAAIPAMIRRFHHAVENNAKEVVIWGSVHQMREFLHVDDMQTPVSIL